MDGLETLISRPKPDPTSIEKKTNPGPTKHPDKTSWTYSINIQHPTILGFYIFISYIYFLSLRSMGVQVI